MYNSVWNASFNCQIKELSQLLKDGHSPDPIDPETGRTPLIEALFCYDIFEEDLDVIKLLLLYGANPYLKDNLGKSAIDYLEKDKKDPLYGKVRRLIVTTPTKGIIIPC